MALTPRQVYKGNPATPGYEPNKDDIIEYLNGLQTRIDAASPVYDSIAEGLAATTVGQFFNAFVDGSVNRYRHDPGPVATFIYEFPSSVAIEEVYALLASIGDYLTGTLTELTSTYSGDGTSDPLELITSVDNPAKIELSVNGATLRPGIDYDSTGVNLIPLPGGDYPEWPVGVNNILVRIRRQLDLTDITSDDVTYDGEPLTNTLDDLFPGNTYHLSRYLHPDDFTAALAGNTAAQNEARVTAAVQAFHDEALGWMMGANGRHVRLVYPGLPLAVNDELFSEAWAQSLWANGGARSNCRVVFDFRGTTFQAKNWTARAAVRTSGLYLANGITYAVPKAMWRWERPRPTGPRIETRGRINLVGAGNRATDPIGVKIKSINASTFDCFFVEGLRNIGVFIENAFNGPFKKWQVATCGYQPTEYGGDGFLPSTVRFTNVGAVVSATEPVFNSGHVGRRFMLSNAGPRNGQEWQVHSGIIASVDSPTQITLSAAPFRNASNPATGSFEAVKVSTTAGSNVATLSASVSDSLVGRYVTLLGAGQNDIGFQPQFYGTMTAVVTAHTGDQITLAHPARFTRSNIPISTGTSFVLCRAAENALSVGGTPGRNDDISFSDLRVENGAAPTDGASLMGLFHHCNGVDIGTGSKFHGVSAPNRNNFGSNFGLIGLDYVGELRAPGAILTHGGYSASAGKIIINGGFVSAAIDAAEVVFPDTTETATVSVDPTADQISVRLELGNKRNDGRVGNAVPARYGVNGTAAMIAGYNSARRLVRGLSLGEGDDTVVGTGTTPAKADFPTDLDDVQITGDVFAPAYGSTRANAAASLAVGLWTPVDGRSYSIGAGWLEGATGDTSVPGLPGLRATGAFTTPEIFGAVGDGVTDDTAAFLAALATKRRVVCDGSKTYAVNDLVVGGNEALNLNEATLVPFSSACRWLVRLRGFDGGNVSNGLLQDASNVTVKTATLTAGASAGATSIAVNAVGQIEAGMVLAIGGTTPGQFAIRKVATASGTTITFDEGIQCDVSSGATVYAAFGLLSIYAENETIFYPRASGLRMIGGGVHLYQHGTPGSDIARGFIENIYSQRSLIAQEVIFNNCHDMDRLEIQSWGDRTLSGSATATTGQTTIDVVALCGRPAIGAVFVADQISLRINNVGQTYTSGAPGAGQYTASADGLTLTVPALTGGETITLSVFDRPFTSVLYDPHGTGSVQGAHKWLRCLYLQNHSCALFENANNSGGLLHLTQVNFDAGSLWGMRIKDTNKVYLTHVFCGFSPFPMIFDLNGSKPDRIVKITALWTDVATAGHFDSARIAAARAVTVNASGATAAIAADGKPKIRVFSWAGPDFTLLDAQNAFAIGSFSEMAFQHWGTIRQESIDPIAPAVIHRAARGSVASKTAAQNNDVIGEWTVHPYDGTAFRPAGNWRFVANQNHTGAAKGTRAELRVTANGATTTTQILTGRIGNDGNPRIELGASGTAGIIPGIGSPEGVVSAVVGSLFLRLDGGAGTSLYVKESGTGNTGWVGK